MPDFSIPENKSTGRFFNLAAWYSLILPPVCFLIGWIDIEVQKWIYPTFCSLFFILAISFFAGVISLFGIPKCGFKKILWKALIGITASVVLEYYVIDGLTVVGLGTTS